MTSYLTPLLFSFICVLVADAFVRKSVDSNSRKRMVGGFRYSSRLSHPTRNAKSIVKAASVNKTDQVVDHFATGSAATFRQRYWHNSVYYRQGGPAFLMIGGEEGEDKSWVEDADLPMMQMAKSNNAMVFLLEHRYYGKSRPTKDMRTANLKYLSSQQALEDIASFVKQMNALFNLGNAKWITFGVSYSGSLSAWMRALYPKLVTGAVSSSAPIVAQVNYIEFFEVVQTVLESYSKTCANNVKKGFTEMRNLMKTTAGRSTLKRVLSLCKDLDYKKANDITRFYEVIIGNYRDVVLHSGVNSGEDDDDLTVAKICAFHMVQTKAPLDQLGDVNTYLMRAHKLTCIPVDYQAVSDAYKDTHYSDDRAWLYQTCTELGVFASTDSKTAGAFFGHVVPIDYYVKQCAEVFGSQFNDQSVYAGIEKTNSLYGGRDKFTGTRVVFTNGANDPSHPFGMLKSKLNKYKAVLIKGTAHGADIYPASSTDPASLIQARKTVAGQVSGWLGSSGCIIC